MSRQKTKICLACGKDFLGNEAAFTCGSACRTYMSRLLKKGKKPEFWLLAKNKGQKLPLFFQPPIKKLETKIDYKETTKESFDAEPLSHLTMDEVGQMEVPLTKEQILSKVEKLRMAITNIKKEACPTNKHPKMFALSQEMRVSELEDEITQLTHNQ